ncbi:MAG: MBL fold metallo-hydrolase [Elusimicrobia bacterium]|nr:MBL fold metallo-hydrolase [Elusimicrobiota bacterium]
MIFLKQLELGPLANFVYILGDPEKKECAVVDPAWDVATILKEIEKEGYKLTKILVTHNHPDHTNGIGEVLKSFDVPVYIHKQDAYALKSYQENLKVVEGGDGLSVGNLELSFLHTPGHTHGSVCLMLKDQLVTGDTLFIKGCGRVDLPNSDPEKMFQSLKKIAGLPDEILVLPGHNYGDKPCAPLKDEKKQNPYLALSQKNLPDFLRVVGF